jgi:hypothetical protein
MKGRILNLESFYDSVIDSFEASLGAHFIDFHSCMEDLVNLNFGTSGIFARNFRNLGWDASVIVFNSFLLQELWSKENHRVSSNRFFWNLSKRLRNKTKLSWIFSYVPGLQKTILGQIEASTADIIIINDATYFSRSILKKIKQKGCLLILHHSSELSPRVPLEYYDVLISSVPKNLEMAKAKGVKPFHFLPGFDSEMYKFAAKVRDIDCSFVGSIYPGTIELLVAAKRVFPDLQIYTAECTDELVHAGLANNWKGPAWGEKMFQILGRSQITLNRHGAVAKEFAGNMRLFEATGMGAALVTDWKPNLASLFDEQEVISYLNFKDLVEKLQGLKNSPEKVSEIAQNGQLRTHQSHTYKKRIGQLSDFLVTELNQQKFDLGKKTLNG